MNIEITSLGWKPGEMGKQGAVIMVAKIRKPPYPLSSVDSVETKKIDVKLREITLLHLGEAELMQNDDREDKEG